ncbi:HIT family protein [Patescibacteria group bacterium]|nr:HIT family protein [Patescibacteria group bacterium]
MDGCVFCNIIKKVMPSEVIYEDKDLFSFLDINPVNYGHLLIIPKKHYKDILDTPEEIISKIFIKAKDLMKAIKECLNADYVCLSVVGVDVPHFHVHLVPRYFNDGMENFWPTKKYPEGEMENISKKLTSYLKKKRLMFE